MRKILIILVFIAVLISACSSVNINQSKKVNEALELKEPQSYKSIDDFKGNMKILKGKNDDELRKHTDGVNLKLYKLDYFFEPEHTPKNAVFESINVRDVYVALVYRIDNDVSKLIPEDIKQDVPMSLADEYARYIVYEWKCTEDENAFKNANNDDGITTKKITINNIDVFYTESTTKSLANLNGKKIDGDIGNIVIRRDYYYMLDGNSIHVALPYNITLEEVDKYLFVKKAFYE